MLRNLNRRSYRPVYPWIAPHPIWLWHLYRIVSCLLIVTILQGCTFTGEARSDAPKLVLYDWEEDIPQSVLDAFTAEYGIQVEYAVYEATEEAVDSLRAGNAYDVVVMENRFIPALIEEALLARIDRGDIPNFKNISLNFRGLIYDPDNQYSIPYSWGTTGMVVRPDLLAEPITRWADLWDARYAGRVAFYRGQSREAIGLTLKSLGYSVNAEDPAALQAVSDRLQELRPMVRFSEDYDPVTVARPLADGAVVAAMGYTIDVVEGRALGVDLQYVLPAEGGLLWGDNFVIPATHENYAAALQFIDFVLRPETSAAIMNAKHFAMANDAAMPYVKPTLAQDRMVFPSETQMANIEIVLPLSRAGEELYAQVWTQFIADDEIDTNLR